MKNIFLISIVLLSSSFGFASIETPLLKSLSCTLSNGVTLASVRRTRSGVTVESYLGLAQKNFGARLETAFPDTNNVISLESREDNDRYVLYLNLDPMKKEKQYATGAIEKYDELVMNGKVGILVAYADCSLELR